MARFLFRLQGVLRQRTHLERLRQRELGVVQGEMSRLQTELRAIDGEVKSAEADVRKNHLVGRLDLNFLAAHRRYVVAMERKGVALVQKMAQLQQRVEAAQKALAAAAVQRKVMEKLRERQFERWRGDLNRKEAAQNDEIAMQLHYRNQTLTSDIDDGGGVVPREASA